MTEAQIRPAGAVVRERGDVGSGDAASPDEWAIDGERLRSLRQQISLSQQQLALRTGIRQQHISSMERRRTRARVGTVMRLASALGVPMVALLHQPPPAQHVLVPTLPRDPGPSGEPPSSEELARRLDACVAQLAQVEQLLQQLHTVQRELRRTLTEVDTAIRRQPLGTEADHRAG